MDASNLLKLIKLQNLFAPPAIGSDMPEQGGIMGNMPPSAPADYQQQPDYGSADPNAPAGPVQQDNQSLFQHTNIDRLNDLIANYPVEQKPSKWRRFGAALVGAGAGPEEAEKFLSDPYEKQVTAWKNKVQPVEAAATYERASNVNQRQQMMQQEKQDLAEKKLTQDTANKEADRKIRGERAAAYVHHLNNPNSVYKEDNQGHIIAIDPQSNKTTILTDTEGNPIESSHLTDEAKINMGITGRLKEIAAQGQNQINAAGARQDNTEKNIATRENNIRTRPPKSTAGTTTGAAKAETPAAAGRRKVNNAQTFMMQNPNLAKYVHINGLNVSVDAPSSGGFFSSGPSKEDRDRITQAIEGGGVEPMASHTALGDNRTPPGFPATTVNAPKAPKGWKYVPKQGGGWTAVKAE